MLSDQAIEDLAVFVEAANWAQLHPLDWDRYYHFIIGTFTRGEALEEPSVVAQAMRDVGAPTRQSVADGGVDPDELASLYYRGRELLKRHSG